MGVFIMDLVEKTQLQKTAGKLLVSAWVIEIIAAAVGLFFAISRLTPLLDGTVASSIIGIQAALPFFAVAIVELTKIPLAYVYYQTVQVGWKIVFGVSLAAAVIITFETFFVGFESYQSHLTKELRPTLDQITTLERGIYNSENAIVLANKIKQGQDGADNRHQASLLTINKQFSDAVKPFEAQKKIINDKYSSNIEPDKKELERRKADLKKLDDEYIENKGAIVESFGAELRDGSSSSKKQNIQDNKALIVAQESLAKAFTDATDNQKQLLEDWVKARPKVSFFARANFDAEYRKNKGNLEAQLVTQTNDLKQTIVQLQKKLNSPSNLRTRIRNEEKAALKALHTTYVTNRTKITEDISRLEIKVATAEQTEKSATDTAAIDALDEKISDESKKRQTLVKSQNDAYSEQKKIFSNQEKLVANASKSIGTAESELATECSELNKKVIDNQVYRIAMQFNAVEDVCDLTEKQLSLTKMFWFGSIAVIVAALGTILAFASFVISSNKPRIIIKEVPVEKNVIVEVIKEVPVEKVIFRDVPVEVIRREVVHIPVYTNDKSLLVEKSDSDDKK